MVIRFLKDDQCHLSKVGISGFGATSCPSYEAKYGSVSLCLILAHGVSYGQKLLLSPVVKSRLIWAT